MDIALYILFMLICVFVFITGIIRPNRVRRNIYFQLTCLFIIIWFACDTIRFTSLTLSEYSFIFSIGLVFNQLATINIFFFSISFYKLPFIPAFKARLPFFIFPAITTVFIFMPAFRALLCDFSQIPVTTSFSAGDFGTWFWIQAVYSYLLLLSSVAIVVYGHLRVPKFYRFPSTLFLIAICLPTIHLLKFLGPWSLPEYLFAPILCVSLILARIALINNDRNIFVKYARGSVFQHLDEYVLVLNKDDLVVDSIPSATAWFESHGINLDFHSLEGILDSLVLKGAVIRPGPDGEASRDICFPGGEFPFVLNLRLHDMNDKQGTKIGSLAIFSDVSAIRGLLDMLEEKAGMDPLTGIANRTSFTGARNRLNKPEHLPLSVVICDVNGLKTVNDTLGHKHGDKLIQVIAKTLESVKPKAGFLARIGGDEFIFLLPGTDGEASLALIDEIQEALRRKNEEVPYDLSVALGAATKYTDEQDLDEITDIADNQMYENKKRIKDQSLI